MELWTVYDHPSDFPHCYVARKFLATGNKIEATGDIIESHDLQALRDVLAHEGLIPIARSPYDDANVIETWC